MDIDLRDYLEERFGRVYDRFDAMDKRLNDFHERVNAQGERIESVNGRIWTVGALGGAAGTGVGFVLAWLETKLGLISWLKRL